MGLGGVYTSQDIFIQDFWREDHVLHINSKEIEADAHTMMIFAKKRERVRLNVDNTVALSHLKNWGGRKSYVNKFLHPLFQWCWEKEFHLDVQWVPSENMIADSLSRWGQDKGDYTLKKVLFQKVLTFFEKDIAPDTDMFASPGNAKFQQYVTRYPHHQAYKLDALNCGLWDLSEVYANPPWKVISAWLVKMTTKKTLNAS